MGWLFLILSLGAALFVLPGGTRSPADRRLAQIVAFTAMAIALMGFGLKAPGLAVLLIGATMFAIGWLKSRLTGEGFQDIDEENRRESSASAPASATAMTQEEALMVLGLKPGAGHEEIRAAYKRLIIKAHPDGGGSDYLAAKVNQARDLLLG